MLKILLLSGFVIGWLADAPLRAQVVVSYPFGSDALVPGLASERQIKTGDSGSSAKKPVAGPTPAPAGPIPVPVVAVTPTPKVVDVVLAFMSGMSSAEITLTTFSSGFVGGGAVRVGTTWEGNVTQNATSITVGGTARDDNGWGVTGLSIDATGMNSITITAQRDAGHLAPSLFLQFEDNNVKTQIFSVDATRFAVGTLTPVQIPIGSWNIDFGPTQITGWSIGGGSVGTLDFRMTFDHVEFSTSAIPEPSTYALVLGLGALGLAARRRVARRFRGRNR